MLAPPDLRYGRTATHLRRDGGRIMSPARHTLKGAPMTPVYRYLLTGRSTPAVFGVLLASATYAFAQASGGGPGPETQAVVRPSTTVFQIEALALAAGFGSAGTGLGWGIRSAAKIVTDYMTKRDTQEAQQKKDAQEHEKAMLGLVAGIAERYWNDRGTVTAALAKLETTVAGVCEQLEDIEKAFPAVARKRAERAATMPHVKTTPPQTVTDGTDIPRRG